MAYMNIFVQTYKTELTKLIENIDVKSLQEIADALEYSHTHDGKIYVIGNGGSAATASHMVNDLGAGLKRREIKSFHIESLADNVAVCTALANDIGYEHIFSMQLKDKIQQKDILIAISCSGNSENITNAVSYAKEQGALIVGVTGFNGGYLKESSTLNFHVQTDTNQYGLVEDLHMIFNHMLYSYFIEKHNA